MNESWFGFLIFLWIVGAPTVGLALLSRTGPAPRRLDHDPVARV